MLEITRSPFCHAPGRVRCTRKSRTPVFIVEHKVWTLARTPRRFYSRNSRLVAMCLSHWAHFDRPLFLSIYMGFVLSSYEYNNTQLGLVAISSIHAKGHCSIIGDNDSQSDCFYPGQLSDLLVCWSPHPPQQLPLPSKLLPVCTALVIILFLIPTKARLRQRQQHQQQQEHIETLCIKMV